MAPQRSGKLKLLDGLCRAIYARLAKQVTDACREEGFPDNPEGTDAFYLVAKQASPTLLEQLLDTFCLTATERSRPSLELKTYAAASEQERISALSALRLVVKRKRAQRS